MKLRLKDEQSTISFGQKIGSLLRGGETIELIGDVGAGKTTFTKGLALGLGVDEYLQSPSYTINRIYQARDGLCLSHYDFYRLSEAGVVGSELESAVGARDTITVIEWAGVAQNVLPKDRLVLKFFSPTELERDVELTALGEISHRIIDQL